MAKRPNAKRNNERLTEDLWAKARVLRDEDGLTYAELAERFNMNRFGMRQGLIARDPAALRKCTTRKE